MPNSVITAAGTEFGGAGEARIEVADPTLDIGPKSAGVLLVPGDLHASVCPLHFRLLTKYVLICRARVQIHPTEQLAARQLILVDTPVRRHTLAAQQPAQSAVLKALSKQKQASPRHNGAALMPQSYTVNRATSLNILATAEYLSFVLQLQSLCNKRIPH